MVIAASAKFHDWIWYWSLNCWQWHWYHYQCTITATNLLVLLRQLSTTSSTSTCKYLCYECDAIIIRIILWLLFYLSIFIDNSCWELQVYFNGSLVIKKLKWLWVSQSYILLHWLAVRTQSHSQWECIYTILYHWMSEYVIQWMTMI